MDGQLLLCELHAHTTWSDGLLTPGELVDLYGRLGFDVLCVTDHVLPTWPPWRGGGSPLGHQTFTNTEPSACGRL